MSEPEDLQGSIFLPDNQRKPIVDVVTDTVPSLEELAGRFLSGDWEQAESVLTDIEQRYPESLPRMYDHLQMCLLIQRGGVSHESEVSTLVTVEVRNFLYNIIVRRRALGGMALRRSL